MKRSINAPKTYKETRLLEIIGTEKYNITFISNGIQYQIVYNLGTDEKTMQESIDAIKSETEHMKELMEQLLFLARKDCTNYCTPD